MKTALALAIALPLLATDQGLKPRKSAADYPSQADHASYSIGAEVLTPELVKTLFSSDLNRGWVVVEVSIYPKDGNQIDVSLRDFMLRQSGTTTAVRAGRPATVATKLQKTAPTNRDITIVPSETIGYESGTWTDPSTGQRRRSGGWYNSSGVGVGVGSNKPASTDRDRDVMEQELLDQMLPEGATAKPVAGYLYFPLPDKKRSTAFDLEFDSSAGRVEIPLATRKR